VHVHSAALRTGLLPKLKVPTKMRSSRGAMARRPRAAARRGAAREGVAMGTIARERVLKFRVRRSVLPCSSSSRASASAQRSLRVG
jgi:hypothetical protein